MTPFNETEAGIAFIASGPSRETSPEIMKAIAFFAIDAAEAEGIWDGSLIGTAADLIGIWDNATCNGLRDDANMWWDGKTLAEIMADA